MNGLRLAFNCIVALLIVLALSMIHPVFGVMGFLGLVAHASPG